MMSMSARKVIVGVTWANGSARYAKSSMERLVSTGWPRASGYPRGVAELRGDGRARPGAAPPAVHRANRSRSAVDTPRRGAEVPVATPITDGFMERQRILRPPPDRVI